MNFLIKHFSLPFSYLISRSKYFPQRSVAKYSQICNLYAELQTIHAGKAYNYFTVYRPLLCYVTWFTSGIIRPAMVCTLAR
jgi:hypothetical protein